jgi:hypothetical protein
MLDVDIKTPESSQTCITKAYLSNLGFKGYLGITGSNKSNMKPYRSIDLVRSTFWNLSPKHYKKPEPK